MSRGRKEERHACYVIRTCSTGGWTTHRATVPALSAPPAKEQVPRVEETAGGSNSSEGNPPGASAAPSTQVQPKTAQNTAQGDSATPLETGTRQRADAERQRAAEARAARKAALTELNREKQQKRIRDAQELTRCLSTGMGLLIPEQVRQITNAVTGTNNEPMDTLRSFNERLETLIEENPHASSADLKEAAESAVQALIAGAKNAKERQQKPVLQQTLAAFEVPREALHLPESRRAARQDIPGPPSGRTLRGAGSEVEQMHNYISRIGTNLLEAIGNRDADLIRSYRRALNSGIARAHEAANREADARGWDPVAVDGVRQEVEESTATLLPAAEQVLQELEEEARASWEERAIYHSTQVTNLAGEAFETLSENRWSRRDCTEYQDELDWVMRTFRRVCDELDLSGMLAKICRAARAREDRVNCEYQRATRVVERLHELREDDQRRDICRLETAVEMRGSIKTSSTLSTCPRRGWSTRTPFPWTRGPPCR